MDLILLLSGNKDKIIEKHNLDPNNVEVVKIDDKHLSKPKHINHLISYGYENVFFVCKNLDLQRFHFFMFTYLLIFCNGKGSLLDEISTPKSFNFFKYIFIMVPKLFIEVLFSTSIVIYYYIRLPYLRWKLIKKV